MLFTEIIKQMIVQSVTFTIVIRQDQNTNNFIVLRSKNHKLQCKFNIILTFFPILHSIIKIICMNVFTFWYVYYDSIFVEPQLQPRKIVLEGFLHEIKQPVNWPCIKEPSISRCFQILQNYIQNPENWQKSNCSEYALFEIQARINKIYTLLLIEKQYAIEFWKSSKRRLQSSICHFFIFFQNLIRAIIPDNEMSIQECHKKKLLCTNISGLQKLAYMVLQNIEKLYLFMNRPQFNSEKILTSQFFEYYQWFIENLCSIKKKDIGKVPKLLEYINLSNPIEISRRKIVEQEVTKVKIRKKSNTIGSKPQRKRKSEDFMRFNYESTYREFNGYIYRTKRFNKSCDSKVCSITDKSDTISSYKIPIIFKFKQEIHQNSPIELNRKKDTISTQDLPINLRSESIQYSNVARTQSLSSDNQNIKLPRSNTVSGSNPNANSIMQRNISMIKGQKKRRKLQKQVAILISGKDEQIERNDLKVQIESFDAFMTKSDIIQKNREQSISKKISLSKGSKSSSKISEQQHMKKIQNKLASLMRKI